MTIPLKPWRHLLACSRADRGAEWVGWMAKCRDSCQHDWLLLSQVAEQASAGSDSVSAVGSAVACECGRAS